MVLDKKVNIAAGLVFGYGLFSCILGAIISFTIAIPVDTDGDLIGELNIDPLRNGLFILIFTFILAFFLYKKKKIAYWLTLVGSLFMLFFIILVFTVVDTMITNYIGMYKISGRLPADLIVILVQLVVPLILSISLLGILSPTKIRTLFK